MAAIPTRKKIKYAVIAVVWFAGIAFAVWVNLP